MERERELSRRDFLKAIGVVGVGVLGLVASESTKGATHDDSAPNYTFMPLPISGETPTPSPEDLTPKTIIEFPKTPVEPTLSPAEIRAKQIASELTNVQRTMSEHPSIFGKKKIEDVGIYYPIYRAVADKYKLDWYLLFIVHEAETGASAGKNGFVPGREFYGAMQLDRNTWSQDYINKAAKGLGYLAKFPQRHDDDWKQIAAGGEILSTNVKRYKKLGKDKSVLNALLLYSADNQALKRFKTYQTYEKLFPVAKPKAKNSQRRPLQRVS